MHTLTNWKAKRAGGRITVNGTENGAPIKLVGVDRIEPSNRPNAMCVLAHDKNGETHTLAI